MNARSGFQWCGICIIVLLLVGCKVKRPNDVLSESKMENILFDYHIAQSMGENVTYNENYKKALYTDAVFQKYGTTEAAFDSSLVWYTRNTEIFSKIYERVSKRMKAQQDKLNHLIALRDRKMSMTLPGDSIDIWYHLRISRLTGTPLDNKITFSIASDTNFKARDTLLWKVRYRFPEGTPDSTRLPVMAMQIVYKNDSILSKTKKIGIQGMHSIALNSDTLGEIKEVKGFIYYPGGKDLQPLLTDHISLTRYHYKVAAKDSLGKDSLRTDSLRADSLHKDSIRIESEKKTSTDSVKALPEQRLSPEEMNRPRTGNRPTRRTVQPASPQPTQQRQPTQQQPTQQRQPVRRQAPQQEPRPQTR